MRQSKGAIVTSLVPRSIFFPANRQNEYARRFGNRPVQMPRAAAYCKRADKYGRDHSPSWPPQIGFIKNWRMRHFLIFN